MTRIRRGAHRTGKDRDTSVSTVPITPEVQSMLTGYAMRWSDFGGGAQIVADVSESSDSDFQPNEDSITSNPILSSRWFKSLSSGRLFKLLTVVLPHLDPYPEDCFTWQSLVNGFAVDSFPYHRHCVLIKGGSVGPVSDRVSLFLNRKLDSLSPGQVLITKQVKGRMGMQVLHFWQIDQGGLNWIHRGTGRYRIVDSKSWEEIEIQPTHT